MSMFSGTQMKQLRSRGIYLQLNNRFKCQNSKVVMILDNASSHVISFAKVDKSCGLSTLELRNMTFVFFPPNVTSVVQPLDQGIIASFKI